MKARHASAGGRFKSGTKSRRDNTSFLELRTPEYPMIMMTRSTQLLRRLLHCGLLGLVVCAVAGAGDPATRFNELGHQMMCICGCNQILLECNHVGCPDSDGMRNE